MGNLRCLNSKYLKCRNCFKPFKFEKLLHSRINFLKFGAIISASSRDRIFDNTRFKYSKLTISSDTRSTELWGACISSFRKFGGKVT